MFDIHTISPIVFTCILTQVISVPPPPQSNYHDESAPPADNETLREMNNLLEQVASISIGDLFRMYTLERLNATNSTVPFSSLHMGKKAAAVAAPYTQDPNGNGMSFLERDLVSYLVDNVISPLIKRVFMDGNVYTYFHGSGAGTTGGSEGTNTVVEATAATAAASTASPTRKRKGTSTTTENVGRNDLLEGTAGSEVISSTTTTSTSTPIPTTTSKPKYTVHRARDRSSTPTSKPYEDNTDDEDETIIFNKIKHL